MRFDRKWGDFRISGAAPAAGPRLQSAAHLTYGPSALALAAGMAALALVLRLYGLADKSLWYDELLTWLRAKLPLAQLAVNAVTHKQFPTYFVLLGPFAWTSNPEWMLRFPSALFGAICVVLVAGAASEVGGLFAGFVAGLLMALSPIEVQFSQEARPYMLGSCLVLTALWALLRIANRPEAAGRRITQAAGLPGAWTAYTLGTVGALCVENNTFPWLFASNLALLVLVLRNKTMQKSGLLLNWACSQGVILGVWLPLLAVMLLMNRGAELNGLLWIPKPNWDSLRNTLGAVYLFRISDMMSFRLLPTLVPGFGAVVALIALFGIWRLRREPHLLAAIGLAVLAMPLTILLLSGVQPLLVPRYLLWSTGPFFILAGIGTAALPPRISGLAGLLLAAGGALSLAPYYGDETKPRWDQASAYLASHTRPDDVVVAENTSVRFVLSAYAQRFPLNLQRPILSWGPHGLASEAAAAQRIWVVYGRVGQGLQEPEQKFREKWAAFGAPAEQVRLGASILILRFDKASATPHDVENGSETESDNPEPPSEIQHGP